MTQMPQAFSDPSYVHGGVLSSRLCAGASEFRTVLRNLVQILGLDETAPRIRDGGVISKSRIPYFISQSKQGTAKPARDPAKSWVEATARAPAKPWVEATARAPATSRVEATARAPAARVRPEN